MITAQPSYSSERLHPLWQTRESSVGHLADLGVLANVRIYVNAGRQLPGKRIEDLGLLRYRRDPCSSEHDCE